MWWILAGLISLTAGQTLERGFTNDEKQLMLDLHNYMRHKVATGQQRDQPAAKYMIALEWDDILEQHAQAWADHCVPEHSHQETRTDPVYGIEGESLSGGQLMAIRNGFERAFDTWFAEEAHDDFDDNLCSGIPSCGHFMQVVWANTTRVGCGWNRCVGKKSPTIFCRYAPSGNGMYYKEGSKMVQYIAGEQGQQCTNCPQGHSFCMKGGLCASATACNGDRNQCKCSIRSCENGGHLDEATCKCICPQQFEGPRCEVPCNDLEPELCSKYSERCHEPSTLQWSLEACRRTCGFCGVFNIKFPEPRPNKNNIITRVLDKRPGGNANRKRGPCTDASGKVMCGIWADQDNCRYRFIKVLCRATCFACRSERSGQCENKARGNVCKYYARTGFCEDEQYKESLARSCAKSCNLCGKALPRHRKTGVPKECRDLHPDEVMCRRLKKRGYCTSEKGWTRYHCARTCGHCPDVPKGTCQNLSKDKNCDLFAFKGFCKQAWTRRNCRRSCNTCT